MSDVGYYSLLLAFLISLYTAIVSIYAQKTGRDDLFESARKGIYSLFTLLSISSMAMIYLLVSRNFQVSYVAEYSNRSLSLLYTISAFWAGQKGSLLFWGWLLSVFLGIATFQHQKRNRELMPYFITTGSAVILFFLTILLFITNPFEKLPYVPQDGQGLNPLLQNPGMLFHPVTLYLGYIGLTIPFAFAISALLTKKLDSEWIVSTRKWTIVSWLFLTLGNLLGAQWAYVELGWGGYWAWDPVENSSLMPWLIATAFLHSVIIQEKRNMLKIWNMSLIVLTFVLTIFGTFITRSGIISSVHSFAASNLGPVFLVFIFLVLIISIWLIISRREFLRSENRLDSILSRESSFLFNNLFLVGIAFATFWGTIFPLVSEAVRGVKITVGPPFFNQVNIPIALFLLVLTGICPLFAWRHTSVRSLRKNFLYPAVISLLALAIFILLGISKIYALIAFTFSIFVLVSILMEFFKGTIARRKISGDNILKSFLGLIFSNRRRYGGYIIHIGMIMIFLGVAGSAFKTSVEKSLKQGESVRIKKYEITFEKLTEYPTENKHIVAATMPVFVNGKKIDVLTPEKNYYRKKDQPTTEVAIRSTLKEDLYAILVSHSKDGTATFKILVNPLVKWIWIGGYVIIIGAIVAVWPKRKRKALGVQKPEKPEEKEQRKI